MKKIIILFLATFIYGQNSSSLKFDGGDWLYYSVPDYRGSDTQGTISFWAKPTSFAANGSVICKSDEASTSRYFLIDITTAAKIMITGRIDAIYNRVTSSLTLTQDVWNHVIVKSNGSSWDIVVNGVNDNSIANTTGTNTGDWLGDMNVASDNLIIGLLRRSDSDYNLLTSYVDEVSVFNYPTTDAQDVILYNNGTPQDITSLNPVDYWKVEEGSGTTTVNETGDISFQFGDGSTPTTYPTWSTDTPGWDSGDDGQDKGYKEYPKFPKIKGLK